MKQTKGKKGTKAITSTVVVLIIVVISLFMDKNGMWDDIINNASETSTHSSVESAEEEIILDAYFIDVGQGDCSLFISDSMSMLIDCGEAEYSDTAIQTLSEYGVESLDYIVATHAHSDHIGAMADVMSEIPVENIIVSQPCEDSSLTATYEKFIDAAETSQANIILAQPDYTFSLGNAYCTILAPFNTDSSNENNNSVVMLITAGETSFLMTGDAEKSVEKELINKYSQLDIDILKAGHHGSSTSSHKDFVEKISPELCIISCGADNKYGHPSPQTVETLEAGNIRYYRTDICGSVTIRCTKNDYMTDVGVK